MHGRKGEGMRRGSGSHAPKCKGHGLMRNRRQGVLRVPEWDLLKGGH